MRLGQGRTGYRALTALCLRSATRKQALFWSEGQIILSTACATRACNTHSMTDVDTNRRADRSKAAGDTQ